jgi:large repetitive protein
MKLSCSPIAALLLLPAASLPAHAFAEAAALNGLTWTPTGATNGIVYYHVAGLLQNGDVLIAGGEDGVPSILASAQLYDPASGRWSFTGSMSTPRVTHTGTVLADGRFLVTGGQDGIGLIGSAEVYDPATGQWSATGTMSTVRALHAAVLLNTGKVLVAGGVGPGPGTTFPTITELYDPATGTWTPTASLLIGRESFTLTLLNDGRVLAAGGQNKSNRLTESEIYDPATGAWTATGSLAVGRSDHTATLLPNGQVLVAGGFDGRKATASAELYDPATGIWTATAPLPAPRYSHRATLLDGNVVLTGDVPTGSPNTWAMYDTASGTWTRGRMKGSHYGNTATLLNNDTILVAGDTSQHRASSEIGAVTAP